MAFSNVSLLRDYKHTRLSKVHVSGLVSNIYVAVLCIAITPPWEFHPGKWSNLVQGFSPLRHITLHYIIVIWQTLLSRATYIEVYKQNQGQVR